MKKTDTLTVIFVPAEIKRQIEAEFNTSKTTVNLALKHVNNSEMAKAIRKRAKELMKIEIDKIQD